MQGDGDQLAEFNRQDWARQMFTIRLCGGRHDGRTMHCPALPPVIYSPEPPVADWWREPNPMATAPVTTYRQTGSVADDGAHLYAHG